MEVNLKAQSRQFVDHKKVQGTHHESQLEKVDHESINQEQERGVYWLTLGKEQTLEDRNWLLCAGTVKPAKQKPAKPVATTTTAGARIIVYAYLIERKLKLW